MTWALDDGVASEVAAWLATYLAHSVALFLLAWSCAQLVRSARVREQLWRAALFGPLVTASVQLGTGYDPLGGRWSLGSSDVATVAATAEPASSVDEHDGHAGTVVSTPAQLTALLELRAKRLAEIAGHEEHMAEPVVAPAPSRFEEARKSWATSASLLVALGIAVLMVRALLEAIRMHRLGDRRPAESPTLLRMVDELRERTGLRRQVRLELTERGASAYATGVVRPRIVIPAHAALTMEPGAMRAMIAHEFGHIVRLDPAWAAAVRSVSALFFFQPLNLIAAKKLDECAEFCCDQFAVDATGDEVALARCLATVAEWIVGPETSRAQAACTMAHSGSPLAERVERILETEGQRSKTSALTRWLGVTAVGMTAIAAPSFATHRTPPVELTLETTDAPEAPAELNPVVGFDVATPGVTTQIVYAKLSESLHLLRREISELRAVCAELDVERSTLLRLAQLDKRCAFLQTSVSSLQRRASSRYPVR